MVTRFLLFVPALALLLTSGCHRHEHQTAQSNAFDASSFLESSRSIRGVFDHAWVKAYDVPVTETASLDPERVMDGRWESGPHGWVASEGKGNRTLLLGPQVAAPFRIELEVTLAPHPDHGRVGDISILLNATSKETYWRSGYALTTGSYWNHCTTFYRLGSAMARTELSPVVPGQTHQVVLEYDGGHIRYWLDGQIILEAWDPNPLAMDRSRWIALRTWDTALTVHRAAVYKAPRAKPQAIIHDPMVPSRTGTRG